MHARIGELSRGGRTLFYVYLAGSLYVEHSDPAELEAYIAAEERGGECDLGVVVQNGRDATVKPLSPMGRGWIEQRLGGGALSFTCSRPVEVIGAAKGDGLRVAVVMADEAGAPTKIYTFPHTEG